MYGYPREEVIGGSARILITSEQAGEEAELINRIKAGERVENFETMRLHKEGHSLDVSLTVSPILDDKGELKGIATIARDISERKQLERTLEQYAAQLARNNRELKDFAYVASHDLQEPLRKIQAFSDRLRSKYHETLGPEGQDYLDRLHAAAQRMQVLIQDLLSLVQDCHRRPAVRRGGPGGGSASGMVRPDDGC